MARHRKRIDAIRALVAGDPVISANPRKTVIDKEWREIFALANIAHSQRRHLLCILHSTRALDDTLKAFADHYGMPPKKNTGLGKVLYFLENPPIGTFSKTFTLRTYFQSSIVDVRNKYMHQSGAFPAGEFEVRTLLAEMDNCLSVVLAL